KIAPYSDENIAPYCKTKNLYALALELGKYNINLLGSYTKLSDKQILELLNIIQKLKKKLPQDVEYRLLPKDEKPKAFQKFENFMLSINEYNFDIAKQLYDDEEFDYTKYENAELVSQLDEENTIEILNRLLNERHFKLDYNSLYLACVTRMLDEEEDGNALDFVEELYFKNNFTSDVTAAIIRAINGEEDIERARKIIKNFDPEETPVQSLPGLISRNLSPQDVKKLREKMGDKKIANLTADEFTLCCKLQGMYGVKQISEIPIYEKRNLLRNLVACNIELFEAGEKLSKDFPLIPKNQEEYCALLPSIVKSLGIEVNLLDDNQIHEFNQNIKKLSASLKELDDEEFNSLEIHQQYSKDEFISDVLNIIKKLSKEERQKVFDYFGFELYGNNNNQTGYSVAGYPANLNNGKKLAAISNPETKAVVEALRPYVVKFTSDNKINCSNKELEPLLNTLVSLMPELRCEIDKLQHKGHSFDGIKHSLKVMQKIVQNPDFDTLNNSDKKLLLIASLLHDIEKKEGFTTRLHPQEGAFDAFYITRKLKLDRNEQIKLYNLIRSHEWLKYVNNAKTPEIEEKRLQSVAFDLQYGNLFEISKIFTIADLKGVKDNNDFYNKHYNSFVEASSKIENYIEELQKSKPLLPVTKIPSASKINSYIKEVKPDGSTNIKGVYKNSKGLVIIRFNEVEDWESLGFEKGSISRGVKSTAQITQDDTEEINTGNIKFFAHGLDYPNQLSKFDAFALPNSDVLLSTSYMERPESKYRLFRPQGVLLDVDTQYIHGGGETDSGSGLGKNIDEFKNRYIFGGERESDRLYISNLIKNALDIDDNEYSQFVLENENKSLGQIEPKETREELIRAFASINSNIRKGNRSYNEMYVSNPRVMGAFAYPAFDKIGDTLEFVERQPDFIKQFALKKDIPLVVFGD
ncbi:HD domain-containing protein, partial [bacterium]|nr:HD domain-containing protein [bacterium]